MSTPHDGRSRVVIENVRPCIEGGQFPIKRTVGEEVEVSADVFADGHDRINCVLLWRDRDSSAWQEAAMVSQYGDRWIGTFPVTALTRYFYTIEGWIDHFQTWQQAMQKRVKAGQDVHVELLIGAQMVEDALPRAADDDVAQLTLAVQTLRKDGGISPRIAMALDPDLAALMRRYPEKKYAARFPLELPVTVDRERARFSAWYEFFPRSCAAEAGQHGTFADCERHLEYVASMGFDVVYFPPIHPIGVTNRKGRNNSVQCEVADVGSPWAIGGGEGGHKSIHPQLGNLDDFHRLVARARSLDMEIAMDLAYQCTPDHPYVKEHPNWFRQRPDGTIQYAENPPKKYQDIYPIDFESSDWKNLWEELKSVVDYWIEQGVLIFRVDNPHTKAFSFWAWMINEVKQAHPDVIFLSEAFTRPSVMYRLAKLGFTQSYTYFTWRNNKWQLTEYFQELTQSEVKDYFRPNLWPNTPDILPEYLQYGGRPAFLIRLVLAATLGASYGIYGPAFELAVNKPRENGSEEYFNSEKYEIKHWPLDDPDSLRKMITRINKIRHENPALQSNGSLRFHDIDNPQMICYSKRDLKSNNIIVAVVNLDPYHTQSGMVDLPLDMLGIDANQPYQVHDLLSFSRYLWQGPRNYVELSPHVVPAHLFTLRHKVRSERDFDYYL
jgi:starch synthase (maltosyl-transferring)